MPQTTVTTSGIEILPRNPYRRSAIFHNPSANIIYIETMAPTTITTSNAGVRIPAASTRTMNWLDDGVDGVVDQWSAVSDTGSNTLVWREFVGRGLPTTRLEEALTKVVVTSQ